MHRGRYFCHLLHKAVSETVRVHPGSSWVKVIQLQMAANSYAKLQTWPLNPPVHCYRPNVRPSPLGYQRQVSSCGTWLLSVIRLLVITTLSFVLSLSAVLLLLILQHKVFICMAVLVLTAYSFIQILFFISSPHFICCGCLFLLFLVSFSYFCDIVCAAASYLLCFGGRKASRRPRPIITCRAMSLY